MAAPQAMKNVISIDLLHSQLKPVHSKEVTTKIKIKKVLNKEISSPETTITAGVANISVKVSNPKLSIVSGKILFQIFTSPFVWLCPL